MLFAPPDSDPPERSVKHYIYVPPDVVRFLDMHILWGITKTSHERTDERTHREGMDRPFVIALGGSYPFCP